VVFSSLDKAKGHRVTTRQCPHKPAPLKRTLRWHPVDTDNNSNSVRASITILRKIPIHTPLAEVITDSNKRMIHRRSCRLSHHLVHTYPHRQISKRNSHSSSHIRRRYPPVAIVTPIHHMLRMDQAPAHIQHHHPSPLNQVSSKHSRVILTINPASSKHSMVVSHPCEGQC